MAKPAIKRKPGKRKVGQEVPVEKHAILVLGMHRSGTSVCTRIANILGAFVPDDLVPANSANVNGYWEPTQIVDLNDQFLARSQTLWDDPTSSSNVEAKLSTQDLQQASETITQIYGSAPLIVLKDPRCSLLPAFWVSALKMSGYSVSIILAHRPAADVAISLQSRDSIGPDMGALLWLQYNTNILRVLRGEAYSLFDYQNSGTTWSKTFANLSGSAGFVWPNAIAEQKAEIENTLETPRAGANVDFTPKINSLVERMTGCLSNFPTVPGADELDVFDTEISEIGNPVLSNLKRNRGRDRVFRKESKLILQTAAQRIADLESERDTARDAQLHAEARTQDAAGEIASLAEERDTARDAQHSAEARTEKATIEISSLELERNEARTEQKSANKRAKKSQNVIHEIERERDDARRAFAQANARADGLSAQIKEFWEDLIGVQSTIIQLDEERRALTMERDALFAERDALSSQLLAIESSSIWRLTRPIRSLAARFPSVTRFTRKAARLVWWTVSFQLSSRLKQRKLARDAAMVLEPPTETKGDDTDVSHLPPFDSLKGFLLEEFDATIADNIPALITRYNLPFQRDGQAPISYEIGAKQAAAWSKKLQSCAKQQSGDPDVSIVIPVYNQIAFTLACIESVLTTPSEFSFEIIVGDDQSSDGTIAAAAVDIPNVRWIRHPENLGFVKNCNATAEHANGRYIVFLNNDTIVLPGWLDGLIQTLQSDDSIGLTGSKLIYPDGRLQEAGGIFWQDGSAWNLGRFENPRKPEYCYARDVDYISGASVAVPKSLWVKLGGFDEHFAPAYAEDADLAFRIRTEGYRTVYQPRSQLLHFEGVTSGTDLTGGAKAHQVTNLQRFKVRWSKTLKTHRPNAQNLISRKNAKFQSVHCLLI